MTFMVIHGLTELYSYIYFIITEYLITDSKSVVN